MDAAKAEGKAIGLLFTNIKTCNPCRRLEKEVLSKPEWKAWADSHLHMVILDGSQHENDKAFDQRWATLSQIYIGSGGIPNFNLVLANGQNGRLHLSFENEGPAFYIAQFTAALERASAGGQP